MKYIFFFIFFYFFYFLFFKDFYGAIAASITLTIVVVILSGSNENLVFREWALLLYGLNYLLSPAITYFLAAEKIMYKMKISSELYFSLAIPGFLLLAVGMFMFRTNIFIPKISEIKNISFANRYTLYSWTIIGVLCHVVSRFFSSDFSFFFYLLSSLRFVGVFSLYAIDKDKYRLLVFLVLGFEMVSGFLIGMFHDAIMWLIFFGIFYLYLIKPNMIFKLIGSFVLITLVLLIQAYKVDFRSISFVNGEGADIQTVVDVSLGNANTADLVGDDNLLSSLNRGNQAWIFASTVDNMDRTQNFQGLNNVNLYLESALLPRFLSPHKITAGNRSIFNEFSGHTISEGTAMGLGVFADGYIAYGKWGVFIFCFVLGLLFSLTFKIVQMWANVSPIYILFIFPVLTYAVRPDCELQTVINHLTKSIVVYGGLVYLTKYRFTIDSIYLYKK